MAADVQYSTQYSTQYATQYSTKYWPNYGEQKKTNNNNNNHNHNFNGFWHNWNQPSFSLKPLWSAWQCFLLSGQRVISLFFGPTLSFAPTFVLGLRVHFFWLNVWKTWTFDPKIWSLIEHFIFFHAMVLYFWWFFEKKKADWRLDQSLPWVFLVSRKNGFYTYLRLLFRPLFSCSRQSLFFLLSSLLLLVSLLHTSWSVTAQENSHF